ncbi:discoidin domain-containing protein [Paenibacillus sp. FSL K6-4396]|uniref:discoidin domain-containing protein n=1 Tax=unclassified Paenibacillus TaxID=185978 RepID=UPI00177BD0EC|nr:discoidin domain-containing protein [Paenibacillus sp. CFBP 13594]MBD8840367.1 discoidin domain-containing protein [Paenibacillus sp. CFBP 13594]
MAAVGDQIKEPEAGWRRYDDTHSGFKYTGSWYKVTGDKYFNGSVNVTTKAADNNYVSFSFYGTKIRIISDIAQDRHSDNTITVDSVTESFNTYKSGTAVLNAIVYEKTNLTLGFHTVTITVGHNRTNFIMDAIDINESGYLSGYALTSPETGWKRYDDNISSIKYVGSFINGVGAGAYNGYSNYTSTIGDKIVFDFEGTKLRIIVARYTNRSDLVEVYVDGELHGTHSQLGSELAQTLQVEIVGLTQARHRVEIVNKASESATNAKTTFMALDAIDINSDGRLFHPDEVTSIIGLEVGKRIRCHFQASTSGVLGTFSGLGKENSSFIPTSGSISTPNGDFYFIVVENWNGDLRLIADRNVQNLISWDALNKDGMVYGVDTIFERELTPTELQGTPFASTSLDASRTPDKAFDGIVSSSSIYWYSDAVASVQWIGYDFGAGKERVISRIGLYGFSHTYNYSPKNFIIQGSNDNANWIDFRTVIDSGVSAGVSSTFDFNNDNAFRYYRIYVTESYRTATVGVVNTGLAEFKFWESDPIITTKPLSIRLLTGGISPTDKDNEWDKYIVGSTLDGKITAGENSLWNWHGMASWTSTTNIAGSTHRTGRGGISVGSSGYNPTSYTTLATATGFRPMIMLPNLLMIKHFLNSDGSYKKYEVDNATWKTISATLPSEETFINDGMDDLSVLDRKDENIVQTMTANGSLGSGKLFKASIDLNKYFEITKIIVK